MIQTKTIDGVLLRDMVVTGAALLEKNREAVDALNVFPVPDGDTGTNMSMTMASAMTEMEKLTEPTLAKAADTTASALLRGARGNSGVILSLLFRGVAKKLRETEQAGSRPARPSPSFRPSRCWKRCWNAAARRWRKPCTRTPCWKRRAWWTRAASAT